jgi:hypothetical protein
MLRSNAKFYIRTILSLLSLVWKLRGFYNMKTEGGNFKKNSWLENLRWTSWWIVVWYSGRCSDELWWCWLLYTLTKALTPHEMVLFFCTRCSQRCPHAPAPPCEARSNWVPQATTPRRVLQLVTAGRILSQIRRSAFVCQNPQIWYCCYATPDQDLSSRFSSGNFLW